MKSIQFTKGRFLFLGLSLFFIVAGLVLTFLQGGLNLGIDFSAGLDQRVVINRDSSVEELKEVFSDLGRVQVQTIGRGEDESYVIRLPLGGETSMAEAESLVRSRLDKSYGPKGYSILSKDFVGSQFAGSLTTQTIYLTLVALLLILVYIWIRFQLGYALSAIVAVIHDGLFLLAFIGALQLEFSVATIAALLTIVGYSLNDTIVIFDRIRENTRILGDESYESIINISITQSLSRTLITSLTTLIAVVAIFVLGTGTVKIFALKLIVGVLVGTYSSMYIASTALLGGHNRGIKKAKAKNEGIKGAPKGGEVVSIQKAPQPAPLQQSAEEIAAATRRKKKEKAKKKKKK